MKKIRITHGFYDGYYVLSKRDVIEIYAVSVMEVIWMLALILLSDLLSNGWFVTGVFFLCGLSFFLIMKWITLKRVPF